MPSIFTAAAGTVMAISPPNQDDAVVTMFKIEIDSSIWGPTVIGGIVTGFSLTGETNVQFTQTLRDVIYITAFGSKMGSMTLSGILFLHDPIMCQDGTPSSYPPLTSFFKQFEDYNAIKRKEPITIVLAGSVTIKGFLLGFQMQVADPQFQIGQFTMQFAAIPGTNN